MSETAISKLDLKQTNRTHILNLLKIEPISRIDISKKLKLTRSAITVIINEMIEEGIILEVNEKFISQNNNLRGRKKIYLKINENFKYVVGVSIRENNINIGICNLFGEQVSSEHISFENNLSKLEIIKLATDSLSNLMENNYLNNNTVLGIGVCIKKDFIAKHCFSNCDFQDLQNHFNLPVVFDKETNAVLISDLIFFNRSTKNAVLIKYNGTLDSAIVVNNEIYTGNNNMAGDISNILLFCDSQLISICDVLNEKNLIKSIKNIYDKEQTPTLYKATNGDVNKINIIFSNLELTIADEPIKMIFDSVDKCIIALFATFISTIDPNKIVLFGNIFEQTNLIEDICNQLNFNFNVKDIISKSYVNMNCLYKAGCGIAVKKLFYNNGGYIKI